MRHIDTHMHTNYSDGDLAPEQIVQVAKLNGIDAMAISDHDNYRGYFEAREVAKKWNIDLIAGVEFSTLDYHILGLGMDIENKDFQKFVDESKILQIENCRRKTNMMKDYGVPIEFVDVQAFFRDEARLGSGNLVRYLVANEKCSAYLAEQGFNDCYDMYKFTKKFKIDEKAVSPKRVISKIHEFGGYAIIAHPFKDVENMRELDDLVDAGLDGLEIQPNYGDRNLPFIAYAEKNGLLTTYGSDYHGPSVARAPLGRGENKIGNDFYDKLIGKLN